MARLDAADRRPLSKLFTRCWAQKRDWLATFMANCRQAGRPAGRPTMHLSLWKDGNPVFFDEQGTANA